MNYDISITAAVAVKLGEAAKTWRPTTNVNIAVDDRMTVAVFGEADLRGEVLDGIKLAWDTGGEPASAEYLALAPLDPTGEARIDERIRAKIDAAYKAGYDAGRELKV